MDFDLSEEQSLIKDQLDRLLADRYGFEARRGYMASAEGWSTEMWARYAEMGLAQARRSWCRFRIPSLAIYRGFMSRFRRRGVSVLLLALVAGVSSAQATRIPPA